MQLLLEIEKNFVTDRLLIQRDIPCLCKIGIDFILSFSSPLPEAEGKVIGWDRRMIEDRAPAGAGTEYTHFSPGLISLIEIHHGQYEISDLSIFNRSVGWCSVFKDKRYAEPGQFWDEED